MKLKCESMCSLCALNVFVINGVEADYEDFGTKFDHNPDVAEAYGCGDMRFECNDSTPEILEKYSITKAEYQEVCIVLGKELNFGECGWCV